MSVGPSRHDPSQSPLCLPPPSPPPLSPLLSPSPSRSCDCGRGRPSAGPWGLRAAGKRVTSPLVLFSKMRPAFPDESAKRAYRTRFSVSSPFSPRPPFSRTYGPVLSLFLPQTDRAEGEGEREG